MSAMTSVVLEMFGKTSTSLAILADFTMSLRHYSLKNGEISFLFVLLPSYFTRIRMLIGKNEKNGKKNHYIE